MKKSILLKSLLAAATVAFFTGCATEVAISDPPPDQVEVIPASPDPGYVWVGGSWEWRNRWVWESGRWAPRPHPGAVWVRGSFAQHGNHRVWVHSHWR